MKQLRDHKALTLIELIIVLAVIAVIGAILVPNLLSATSKAKLKSDIQSAKVIQNAIDLYNAEQTRLLDTSGGIQSIMEALTAKGYIKNGKDDIQTEGANWRYDETNGIRVDITSCTINKDKVIAAYNSLTDKEKLYVKAE